MNLKVQPTRAVPHPAPIPIMWKRKAVIAVATYQHYTRLKGASIDMCLFALRSKLQAF